MAEGLGNEPGLLTGAGPDSAHGRTHDSFNNPAAIIWIAWPQWMAYGNKPLVSWIFPVIH
jgi:hypothetical protein